MTLARARFVLAVAVSLMGVPASAASLVGIWYGEGQPDDPNILSLLEFRADGTYRDEFRKYENCKVIWSQKAEGTWTVQDAEQTLTTTKLDGQPVHFVNHYTTTSLTETNSRSFHHETGYTYNERRVTAFEFPDCFKGV